MFRDVLLHLTAYPEPLPTAMIETAVDLCSALGDCTTAVSMSVDIPDQKNALANTLVKLDVLEAQEEARSRVDASMVLRAFDASAQRRSMPHVAVTLSASSLMIAERLASLARSHDICVVPYSPDRREARSVVQHLVFHSGRPVLFFEPSQEMPRWTEKVVVAWDGSRSAARAVADALPILKDARAVTVLSILNEKPGLKKGMGQDLIRNLSWHGVQAAAVELDGAGAAIGDTLSTYIAQHGVSLLVMGAYSHSQAREAVLGGATHSMLRRPALPILMSH